MNVPGTASADTWSTFSPVVVPRHTAQRASQDPLPDAKESRVLLVSYAFPPTGGGGVQRSVKFVKYMSQYGWRPTVLTVANQSVPVRDQDLLRDIDPRTRIIRANTWEPGYGVKRNLAIESSGRGLAILRRLLRRIAMHVLQPDPQILWNPHALRAATEVLRTESHDAILATGPPFSSFLLGRQLKKRFGLPLVLDFRDEWLLVVRHLENYQLNGLTFRLQQAMMRKVLRAADAVVATTQASAAELQRHCRAAGSHAEVSCIYNGFDPDDLDLPTVRPSGAKRLRIVYTGTLWALTSIRPLVAAIELLSRMGHERLADIELVVVGRRTAEQDAVIDGLDGSRVTAIRHDYLPHGRALEIAATADALLLLLADQPGAERVVPAKLFEYMALGSPILAIGPEGETSRLLRQYRGSGIFRPGDTIQIANWLGRQLDTATRLDEQSEPPRFHHRLLPFSRPKLAAQMASLLNRCAS